MKREFLGVFISVLLIWGVSLSTIAMAAEPIVIGVCTSLGLQEGYEPRYVVEMAVEEINARGGVNIGGEGCGLSRS